MEKITHKRFIKKFILKFFFMILLGVITFSIHLKCLVLFVTNLAFNFMAVDPIVRSLAFSLKSRFSIDPLAASALSYAKKFRIKRGHL